ncbi:putative endonuclease [Actinokineospora baliensis]|uniref:YraN family protein n=1 Tax=Actinokineospora baliensis TaxID=547056 RepID=UPI0019567F7E|nr:YraN family protein [Actinokineospora baliensis]MBM7772851.1 putative endonuclease [Actinokineospora baliensis]
MARHLRVGALGEDIAARYLTTSGLVVLARNWRCELGELDVICGDDGRLVVCEVKTRTGTHYGGPAEAVTDEKARRVRALARRWRLDNGIGPVEIRFDIVSVLLPRDGEHSVRHLRGVF